MTFTSLCVYCGAAPGIDPDYAAGAERLGQLMADSGIRLVYGGGDVGLMGIVARSVLRHGGAVTGIIPRFLKDREIMLREATDLIVTEDMHERKRLMFDRSDAFLALPGGIGTLEETVEMMTWAQLGQHAKPIVLANLKGFWDPLVALLRHMEAGGFLHAPRSGRSLYMSVDRIDEVLPTINGMVAEAPAQAPEARTYLM